MTFCFLVHPRRRIPSHSRLRPFTNQPTHAWFLPDLPPRLPTATCMCYHHFSIAHKNCYLVLIWLAVYERTRLKILISWYVSAILLAFFVDPFLVLFGFIGTTTETNSMVWKSFISARDHTLLGMKFQSFKPWYVAKFFMW